MAYTYIKDFREGVDRRRKQSAAPAGSLYELINAHITRGGDIEKRKAFVQEYVLPAGTFGLHAVGEQLYVFGGVADPGVPAGVVYQQLAHPGGAVMTRVLAADNYNGKPYVVAQYSDNSVLHFYDGEMVYDWNAGTVQSWISNNADVAEYFQELINQHPDFTATRSSNEVTITGPIGEDYAVETTVEGSGTMTVSTLRSPIANREEVRAVGQFSIVDARSGSITSVKAGSTSLISGSVAFSVDPAVTAANVATAINDQTSVHGYEASSVEGVVYIYAPYGDGTAASGRAVEVTVSGQIVIGDASFKITGGTASAGVNKVSSVSVDGIELLSGSIDWATSNSSTASAIAADIRSGSGSHGFTALANGETVRVSRLVTNSDQGEVTLKVVTDGDVTLGGGAKPATPTGSGGSNPIDERTPPPPGEPGHIEK